MDATLVPIIQGLITVAGTLGGAWLGFWLSKAREERQWRRDRCLDAYAQVLTLSTQVLERCEDPIGRTKCDPEERRLIFVKNVELNLAYEKAVLLAPITVQERIADLVGFCNTLAWSSAEPEHFNGVWEKMLVHHGHLVNRVMRVARPDLGSPSISPEKSWWRAGFR